ncbi:MAG: Ig domain-containing protein [Kiritimatiellae bacterium]|nr:Ig domain-containing protein [Kiritimatiellia bacterium]
MATEDYPGVMVTTNLSVQAGTVVVNLRGLGWSVAERTFTVGIGSDVRTLTCTDDRSALPYVFDDFSETFEVSGGAIQVTIRAAKNKRVLVDDVVVTQEQVEDSPAPSFAIEFSTPSTVQETEPVAFSIGASVRGSATNITLVSALPSGASYAVANLVGTFSWTPALGQAGVYPLDFTAPGGDGKTYTNTVSITVNALPLTAPANLVASNIGCEAFDLSWDAVPAASQGYVVSVWAGSGATNTPSADAEPFYDIARSGTVSAPYGWTFNSVTEKYVTTDYVELKFDGVGDTIITKAYPIPVTSLAFNLRGVATSSLSNSVVRVYGTADDATWTELQTYNSLADQDGDDENNIFTSGDLEKSLLLSPASGYRRFKFVYAQDEKGSVGIGNIAVVYDGCGTRFIGDWNNKGTTSPAAAVEGARAGRDHYVLVGARDDVETKYSLLGLTTPEAPPMTIIVVR